MTVKSEITVPGSVLTPAQCDILEADAENVFLHFVRGTPYMDNKSYDVIKGLIKNYRTGSFDSAYISILVKKNSLQYVDFEQKSLLIHRRKGVCKTY